MMPSNFACLVSYNFDYEGETIMMAPAGFYTTPIGAGKNRYELHTY